MHEHLKWSELHTIKTDDFKYYDERRIGFAVLIIIDGLNMITQSQGQKDWEVLTKNATKMGKNHVTLNENVMK